MRRFICWLIGGHIRWTPANSPKWNMVEMTAEGGGGVRINVCQRCGSVYSEIFSSDEHSESIKHGTSLSNHNIFKED